MSITFNSPEGIRLIDTQVIGAIDVSHVAFNSPEGIRLIDTLSEDDCDPSAKIASAFLSTPLRELDSLILGWETVQYGNARQGQLSTPLRELDSLILCSRQSGNSQKS
jgi:hypothetical protein